MDLNSLIATLEAIAPPALADPIDEGRIGLISRGKEEVHNIAVALDPTAYVITEAVRAHADALITHHTLIWNPVTKILPRFQDELKHILANDISLYVLHTNYDAAPGGVNDTLANLLRLQDVEPFGIGRIGTIEPVSMRTLAERVARILNTRVQFVGKGVVRTVAVIGGSGFYSTEEAISAGADVLVSAELKHDVIRNAQGRLCLIDATHYATEAPAMRALADRIGGVFIDDPPRVEDVRAAMNR
ncbi:MAG: Nif3-like dinuclear metal center hexameric protein [Euryarchaeota archaeon]|nr:Nif3-like dinuclear metal center hexameric protein [Euryarchaeota archaeon]